MLKLLSLVLPLNLSILYMQTCYGLTFQVPSEKFEETSREEVFKYQDRFNDHWYGGYSPYYPPYHGVFCGQNIRGQITSDTIR